MGHMAILLNDNSLIFNTIYTPMSHYDNQDNWCSQVVKVRIPVGVQLGSALTMPDVSRQLVK